MEKGNSHNHGGFAIVDSEVEVVIVQEELVVDIVDVGTEARYDIFSPTGCKASSVLYLYPV